MGKTSCKKGQYYCNTDKKCKPIPDGYEVREDGFLVKEGWSDKYKKSIDCDNPKGFSQKAHCAGKKKKMTEESNPRIARKKGQPAKSKKHSDLYTDEDPKGTIHGLGFKNVATAKASVAKIRKSSRSHAHKIQAAIAMEQRARVMGKTSEAAVYRKFINSMKKKTKKMNEEKHGDHEPEMIRSQLKTASRASKRIEKHSRKKENFKAWVQSKITKASDYLDTAADYLDGKDDVKEGSLHKWFKGSKSKDGKGGWVNVVTGGTCASDEPGEGTPKCVSSAKRASMSKKERLSAARRKKKADPGQQQKRGAAKPTYVSTDKPKKKKKMKEEFISLPLQLEVPQSDGEFKLGLMFRESLEQDRGMLFIFENTDRHSFHMKNTFIPLDIAFINEEGIIESIKELDPMNSIPVYPDGKIRYAIEVNRGWFAENDIKVGDIILEDTEETEIDLNEVKDKKGKGSGTKDACYHKVKSRYSVWPSAYASGALVKCRKVGAANWGNSSKKEEVEYEYEVPTKAHHNWRETLDEKCWKGYEKKGMKTMFGKRYPNCVKKTKKEELEVDAPSVEEKKQYNPNAKKEDTFDKGVDKQLGIIPLKKIKKEVKKIDEKLVHGNFGNFIKGQKLDKKKEKKYTKPPYEDLAASVDLEGDVVSEKKMTPAQKRKDTMLKKKYDDSDMKKNMQDQYGKEEGEKIYFAKIRKDAMKEDTAIESELVIQDWNVDDIKFTEIETVDIIKAKPLKESKAKIIGKGLKALGKVVKKKGLFTNLSKNTKIKPLSPKSVATPGTTYASGGRFSYGAFDDAAGRINYAGAPPKPIKTIYNYDPSAIYLKKDAFKGGGLSKGRIDPDFGDRIPVKDYIDKMKRRGKKYYEPVKGAKFGDKKMATKGSPSTPLKQEKLPYPKPRKEGYDWREELGEDWQKVNRKDKTDGMSKAAVKAYRKENPGSKLKTAVTKDPKKLKKGSKSAKRRLAFCRRMKGMKKKLTSAKTSRDPDSRINKALRRWNC